MQRDKTRLKLLSFLLNPFGESEEEARRKPGRDQAGLCYLWVPHPQATPRSLSGVHFLWGQGQEWACAGPALRPAHPLRIPKLARLSPKPVGKINKGKHRGPDLA